VLRKSDLLGISTTRVINHWNKLGRTTEVSPPQSNAHVRFGFVFTMKIMTVFEKK